MKARTSSMLGLFLLVVVFVGCGSKAGQPTSAQSSAAPAYRTEKKDPVLYTAKQCFSSMVDLAQRWQPDALPFHFESELTNETTGQGGKAVIWRAMFVSQSRGTMKAFICSGSRLAASPAFGFTSTSEMPYAANVPALMFHPSYLQYDSDKAFALTLAHGGTTIIKQHPEQPVIYLLDWDPKQKELLWQVIYGSTQADRRGLGVINAATGTFIRAGK